MSRLTQIVDWPRRHGFAGGLIIGVAYGVVVVLLVCLAIQALRTDGLPEGDLVIVSGQDETIDGQRQRLIDQWNELHEKNKATIIELPRIADAQHAEMVARAQSGDRVDIYNLDSTWVAEFAEAGYIQPLDESGIDTSGFLEKPLETCRYDGNLWALPFNTDAGLLYYRTDLVSKPHTWAMLKQTAENVLARPVSGDRWPTAGYVGQMANYEGLTVNALEAIQSVTDGKIATGDRITVDNDDLQSAVNRLRPDSSQLVPEESLEYDEQASTDAFRDGKALFMRNWPVAYRKLKGNSAGESSGQQIQFGVAPLPWPSVLGGQNLAIAKNSANPKAARALIEFLTSDRSQQILFERGGLPATRQVVYRDEAVRQDYPYAEALRESVERAHPRPVTPCYAEFSEVFRTIIDRSLRTGEPLPADFKQTLESVLQDC